MAYDKPRLRHASVNTDPISKWLKERNVQHVKIKAEHELDNFFYVGDQIGRGGFAEVMEVQEKRNSKIWAMKAVDKSISNERLKLVQTEIRILKIISHPHIIYLEKVYETPKKIYMILEKCNGELLNVYKNQKPFSEMLSRKIMSEIVSALSYLHKYDIVHRDLKLENVLLTNNPFDPNDKYYTKLSDFGLSVITFGSNIVERNLQEYCGTPYYMAPEMVSNQTYGCPCDIWSAGVILYMMVVGDFPFKAHTQKTLNNKICNADIAFPVHLNLSQEVVNLIRSLLEKDPTKRITAADIVEHPWIQNRPLSEKTSSKNILKMLKDENRKTQRQKSDWERRVSTTKSEDERKGSSSKEPMDLPKTNIIFDGEDDSLRRLRNAMKKIYKK